MEKSLDYSTTLNIIIKVKPSWSEFPKNKHFLPPDTHTHVCVSGGKKCSFFGNFGMLCFLETPILRFTLLPLSTKTELLNLNKNV